MRIRKLFILFILIVNPIYCWAISYNIMEDSVKSLNNTGIDFFYRGDYENAEVFLSQSLNIRKEIYPENHLEIAKAYNNLGVLNKNKWQYELALEYLNNAKSIYESNKAYGISLANVYSNIGSIFRYKGDYLHAEDYYNKALEYLMGEKSSLAFQRRAELLNGYALLEIERKKYSSAISLARKGLYECNKVLANNSITIHNLLTTAAEAYSLSNKPDSCLNYIQESIKLFQNNENLSKQFKAESYLNLSEYYLKQKEIIKAIVSIETTEKIFNNSAIDSVYYFEIVKLYAKYYEQNGEYENAIQHYNKAKKLLIKKNNSIASPEYASPIKGISLLKDKSNCLLNWYKADKNEEHLVEVLTELGTVSQLIDKARNGYLSIESKLLLTESEGAVYEMGLLCSSALYDLNKDLKYIEHAFYFAEKGKSSVLLEALNEEKAKSFAGIPDSILTKEQELNRVLAFYKENIYEEGLKNHPDSLKIKTWKNYIFKFSLEKAQLKQILEKRYPEYFNFKYRNNSIRICDVQKTLDHHSSIIEYAVTDSLLYTFVINRNNITFYKTEINNKSILNINNFLNQFKNFEYSVQGTNIFHEYELCANMIYRDLIEFIKPSELNNKLIIIPDGILSYIPFEALVCTTSELPIESFGDLDYLLYNHSILYSYSASLYNETHSKNKRKIWNKTIAISPEYNNDLASQKTSKTVYNNYRSNLRPLPFALKEVEMVKSITKGKSLIGKEANIDTFMKIVSDFDILHLAMHTVIDDNNPLYSKLVFCTSDSLFDDGLLTTSEIFSMKLKAKLTVLSACSSGEGDFKKGEGVMSLSRGFFYAGCQSLIMTLWKVEDASGLKLMKSFYRYLLKGYSKSNALKRAKIDYLKTAPEQIKHPFYWSSYILIGNPSPLYFPKWILFALVILCIVLFLIIKKKISGRKINLPEPILD